MSRILGYWVIGESPFMQGVVGEIGEVRRAAVRSDSTPFQVTLAWLHQLPNVATSTWAHLPDQQRLNLDADRVDLDQDTIDEISSITRGEASLGRV
jgi:diketogulonate reductase-like aldo/keto reductase